MLALAPQAVTIPQGDMPHATIHGQSCDDLCPVVPKPAQPTNFTAKSRPGRFTPTRSVGPLPSVTVLSRPVVKPS